MRTRRFDFSLKDNKQRLRYGIPFLPAVAFNCIPVADKGATEEGYYRDAILGCHCYDFVCCHDYPLTDRTCLMQIIVDSTAPKGDSAGLSKLNAGTPCNPLQVFLCPYNTAISLWLGNTGEYNTRKGNSRGG